LKPWPNTLNNPQEQLKGDTKESYLIMTIELIWIAGVVVLGSCIIGSALYSEATTSYRRMFAKSPVPASYRPQNDRHQNEATPNW